MRRHEKIWRGFFFRAHAPYYQPPGGGGRDGQFVGKASLENQGGLTQKAGEWWETSNVSKWPIGSKPSWEVEPAVGLSLPMGGLWS